MGRNHLVFLPLSLFVSHVAFQVVLRVDHSFIEVVKFCFDFLLLSSSIFLWFCRTFQRKAGVAHFISLFSKCGFFKLWPCRCSLDF